MAQVDLLKENQRQQKIKASLPFRYYQDELLGQTAQHLDSLNNIKSLDQLYRQIRQTGPKHQYSRSANTNMAGLNSRTHWNFLIWYSCQLVLTLTNTIH